MAIKNAIFTVHGYPVLAWAQTETHSDGTAVGVILVQTRVRTGLGSGQGPEWCIARYRMGNDEWDSGDYQYRKGDAFEAFQKRVKDNGGIQ